MDGLVSRHSEANPLSGLRRTIPERAITSPVGGVLEAPITGVPEYAINNPGRTAVEKMHNGTSRVSDPVGCHRSAPCKSSLVQLGGHLSVD